MPARSRCSHPGRGNRGIDEGTTSLGFVGLHKRGLQIVPATPLSGDGQLGRWELWAEKPREHIALGITPNGPAPTYLSPSLKH